MLHLQHARRRHVGHMHRDIVSATDKRFQGESCRVLLHLVAFIANGSVLLLLCLPTRFIRSKRWLLLPDGVRYLTPR